MKDATLFSKTLDYLKERVPGFVVSQSKTGRNMFTCPKCGQSNSCTFTMPESMEMMSCYKCDGIIGDIVAMVRLLEKDKESLSHEDIVDYLCRKYKIATPTTSEDIQKVFNQYKQMGFDLVPIQANGKIPIEKEWPTKNHKELFEWNQWLDRGANIGVKTGKSSGITILDLDTKVIPKELESFLKDYKGVMQESTKGYHYFFRYDKDLPKTRIQSFLLDIENDGGQVVIFPSVVEGLSRKLSITAPIPAIDEKLKTLLLNYCKAVNSSSVSQVILPELNGTEMVIPDGNRTSFLMSFGGALRKELGIKDINYTLSLINKFYCKPSLPRQELDNVVQSLDKYAHQDTRGVMNTIMNYLKIVGEASARDCKEVANEKKEVVDKALSSLVKDGYLIKKRQLFHVIKKAQWKDNFFEGGTELPFKVPFFNKYAILNWGDLVILGSKTKFGKTTIAMNLVKSFVDQGIKPYYISLETGSRFVKTATKLGLKEGDFYWDFLSDPTKIELEQNGVTILDWLLIEDKAATDTVLKHFVEQLYKTQGFLIIFMQLKTDGNWFAPNMVEQFPALAAKYLYDKEADGTYGKWMVEAVREPRYKTKKVAIPCLYDFGTRILTPMDELQADETVNTQEQK